MKSIRGRLTITYMGLVALMIIAIWSANRLYLEKYYISDKVQSLNEAYLAIDKQIAENDNFILLNPHKQSY